MEILYYNPDIKKKKIVKSDKRRTSYEKEKCKGIIIRSSFYDRRYPADEH